MLFRAHSLFLVVATLFSILSGAQCGNALNPDFLAWMNQNLQPDVVTRMVRDDVVTGSFGGGSYSGDIRPVVMVHGLNNEAGSLWSIRAALVAGGIPVNRTFATTWGAGEIGFNLNSKLSCDNVIQIRTFIEVVLEYTQAPQINIIGYSMGSPLVRKAILGGNCVDNTTVNIGANLTSRVHTYISVAGANQGSFLCALPISDVCNLSTGLSCGSKFLKDINAQGNYEATFRSYNLASTTDNMVGYYACFKKASSFTGAIEHTVSFKSHTETEYDTGDIQLQMLAAEAEEDVTTTPAAA